MGCVCYILTIAFKNLTDVTLWKEDKIEIVHYEKFLSTPDLTVKLGIPIIIRWDTASVLFFNEGNPAL